MLWLVEVWGVRCVKTLLLYSIRSLWCTFSHEIWDFFPSVNLENFIYSFHFRSKIPENWRFLYIACKLKNSKNSIEWLIKFVIEKEDKKLSYLNCPHTCFEMIYFDPWTFRKFSSFDFISHHVGSAVRSGPARPPCQ